MTSKDELERLYDDYEYLMQEYYKCQIIGLKEEQIIQTKENVNHIKQDLERLEQLEDNIKIHKETIKMQHNQIESLHTENAKLKKVIEILKGKTIIIFALKLSNDLNDYNRMTSFENLTQEEFELLKEYFR